MGSTLLANASVLTAFQLISRIREMIRLQDCYGASAGWATRSIFSEDVELGKNADREYLVKPVDQKGFPGPCRFHLASRCTA